MRQILKATDQDLRFLTYKYEYVIAEFVSDSCQVCRDLVPAFDRMVQDAAYKDILFLVIDSKENPVSSREVELSGTPFVATYKKSTLRDCQLVKTEEEVKGLLDRLLLYDN